jgi:hypothetical protein
MAAYLIVEHRSRIRPSFRNTAIKFARGSPSTAVDP